MKFGWANNKKDWVNTLDVVIPRKGDVRLTCWYVLNDTDKKPVAGSLFSKKKQS